MYRLDVVFDGALEEVEEFTNYDEVWPRWNEFLTELETNYFYQEWSISLYDERTEPPELITYHYNDGEGF